MSSLFHGKLDGKQTDGKQTKWNPAANVSVVFLCVCVCVCLFVLFLWVFVSLCLPVRLCLPVCPSVCLSVLLLAVGCCSRTSTGKMIVVAVVKLVVVGVVLVVLVVVCCCCCCWWWWWWWWWFFPGWIPCYFWIGKASRYQTRCHVFGKPRVSMLHLFCRNNLVAVVLPFLFARCSEHTAKKGWYTRVTYILLPAIALSAGMYDFQVSRNYTPCLGMTYCTMVPWD